jgi:hypothetical protein
MKFRCIIALAIAFGLPLANAQDFRKSYAIGPKGNIRIVNPQGNIKVYGYTGKEIEVLAFKKGPDRDFLEIQDNSFGNQISLFPRYLQFGRAIPRMNASVDFEIRVPKSIEYNFSPIKSLSGNVEVTNVIGSVWAESVGGNVEIRDVQGLINASSISGSVHGDFKQTPRLNKMWFRTISGSILVKAPFNLNAMVKMQSDAGLLKTDFPIEIQEMRYGLGKFVDGKLGAGTQTVDIRSVYGNISLIQKN